MKTREPKPLSPALVARRLEELRALYRLAQSLRRARRTASTRTAGGPEAAEAPDRSADRVEGGS